MQTHYPRHTTHTFYLIVLMFSAFAFNAQATEDPLGKPNVWEKIKKTPIDSVLWAQYYGKAWVCMGKEELFSIQKWQRELMKTLELHRNDEIITWDEPKPGTTDAKSAFIDHAVEEEKTRLEVERKVYLKDLEVSMLREPNDVVEMKKNIASNFIIIEEWYEEQFDKLGIKYTWYDDKYPKENYNKSQWIHEKEAELKVLKKKEFDKKKATMLAKGHF